VVFIASVLDVHKSVVVSAIGNWL